jgi:putative ABC transport system permease protein
MTFLDHLHLSAAHIWRHRTTSLLVMVMIGVTLAVTTTWKALQDALQDQVRSESSRADAVVGAKGSPLQLVLSTLYHMEAPTGNIPISVLADLDSIPGIHLKVPISLGDAYSNHRIIGTTHAFLTELYTIGPDSGRIWDAPLEAVVGSRVNRSAKLGVGSQFISTHGLGTEGEMHEDAPFTVVGVLPPTGSVLDDLILTSLESVWHVHAPHVAQEGDEHPEDHHHHDHDHVQEHHAATGHEITAVLIRFANPYLRFQFTRNMNAQTPYLAAIPVYEMGKLLTWLGFGSELIRKTGLAFIVLFMAAIIVMLSLMMKDRIQDVAVLRNNGFKTRVAVWVPWLDTLLLASGGVLLGMSLTALFASGMNEAASDALPYLDIDWAGTLLTLASVVIIASTTIGLGSAFAVVRAGNPSILSRLSLVFVILTLPSMLNAQNRQETAEEGWKTWRHLSEVSYELRRHGRAQYYWPIVSPAAMALDGKTVTVRGYLILQLAEFQTRQFYLSKVPESQCFFCGGAGPESLMEVWTKSPVPKTSQPITLRGRLVINTSDPERTLYSLVDAEWFRD